METVINPGASALPASAEDPLYRKVTLRIVPFLVLCYVVAYLDRVNVGFAKLQMLQDLQFSDTVYGLGAGIFFLGYFIFEVPSNIILHRVGARRWIARIMITWGIISSAMIFVTTPGMFYLLRFLLGLAEAGFFPGIILYLTYWFPHARRGRITTFFMTAVPLSGLIGGPISGWIMHTFHGDHGMAGWQWLFILEGIPSVIIGLIVLVFLDDRVSQAKWLTESERATLARNIEAEEKEKQDPPIREAMTKPRVWAMASIYFSFVMGLYGVGFWMPTLVRNTGVQDPLTIGLLTAVPNLFAVIGMVLISRSSDRKHERRWHLAVPSLIGAAGLVFSALYAGNTWIAIAALTVANVGICTVLPLFWSLPTAVLGGTAAAAGIALINSVSNLAGFISPYLVGWLKDTTGSTNSGIYVLAACLCVGALVALAQPAKLVNR
ncbi:MFS transporter [Bordetella genomosp. 11]|uniref:Putative tartrate transporter n=1 Tax=Bordetella genomosp. 11 TaxID=1416808 RepID=A0A261UIM2_9BORD|nr:MFS transporter [Bordetella genomosp. 11]OZI61222.1 MFS transporter [Bordetella genomosp. 11]